MNIKGKEVTVPKGQVKTLIEKHQSLFAQDVTTALKKSTVGKVEATAGHALKSGSNTLSKEWKNAPRNTADTLGSIAGDAIFNYNRYNSLEGAATDVGKGTIINTLKGSTQKAAFKAIKGGIKELSPELAKKIPGLNTLNGLYYVGSSIAQSKSPEEVLKNAFDSSLNLGISYACTAAGQAIIPIPFVGSFIGSLASSAVIYFKDQAMYGDPQL